MSYICAQCGQRHDSTPCPFPTTTTDPTPETAKDRQLIYWQQQCAASDAKNESLKAELEQAQKVIDRVALIRLDLEVDYERLMAELESCRAIGAKNAIKLAKHIQDNERLQGLLNDPVRLRKHIEQKMDQEALK